MGLMRSISQPMHNAPKVSCGGEHTVARTAAGEVFSFGWSVACGASVHRGLQNVYHRRMKYCAQLDQD